MKCDCKHDSFVAFATRIGMICDKCHEIMNSMIDEAGENISYCGSAKSWTECFTIDGDYLMFWFNMGKNTHVIRRKYQ